MRSASQHFGLDTYPNQIEIITAKLMFTQALACQSVTVTGRSVINLLKQNNITDAVTWAWRMKCY